jgi:hypothetical protein
MLRLVFTLAGLHSNPPWDRLRRPLFNSNPAITQSQNITFAVQVLVEGTLPADHQPPLSPIVVLSSQLHVTPYVYFLFLNELWILFVLSFRSHQKNLPGRGPTWTSTTP